MEKVFTVQVQDWDGKFIVFSIHKTQDGAEKNIKVANGKFGTQSAYVDEWEFKE